MFKPQPTPFPSFYPAYLSLPVEENGVRNDLEDLEDLKGLDRNFQVTGYCNDYHQQVPYAPLSGPLAPQARPGDPGGDCRGGHDIGTALAHGGAATGIGPSAPPSVPVSRVFPFHSSTSTSNIALFDNCNQQLQQQQHSPQPPTLLPQQQKFAPIRGSVSNIINRMEQSQSLQDELAAQEAAARTWQPELEGPRVGDKTPIAAITEEYAKGDPIYVAKTLALPETYSHYRPVKGDGNCGWRAIGFCYFELLIQQGSQEFVDGERLRLTQLNDYLVNEGGHDPLLFEDFLDETFELMKEISANIHDPDAAAAVLTTKFNDDASMGILYHLRLLASAWLKGHSDQYGAWCGNDPDQYCQAVIEPPEHEIDELGISLLVEVLLKPAGFILEIAYLDRSAGSKANVHRFPDEGPSNSPVMHLLYRPGHYDILYKTPSRLPPTEIQVNRMAYEPTNFTNVTQFQNPFDMNPLTMLPGFGTVGPVSPMGQLGGSSLDYSPSPQSPWFPSPYADSSPTPPLQGPPPQQTALPTQSLPGPSAPASTTHDFRFSRYQYEETIDASVWPEQPLQTNTFKNSHFNTAHFNNPNFQPEEYRPGVDDPAERCERPGRKRSHGKAGHHSSDDNVEHTDTKER